MKEMTSRQRWLEVINGRIPDRVPMDYQGTPELTNMLMTHLNVPDMDALYDRLHIDAPKNVSPTYIGPAIPDDEDIYGCRYKQIAYGTGVYDECVFGPLAHCTSIDEIADTYSWPSADWYDYSAIHDQLDANRVRPTSLGMAGMYTQYTHLRGMEQAFMDFAENHDMVMYCMEKMVEFHYEKARRAFEQNDGSIDIATIANDMGSQINLLFSPDTMRKLFLPGIRKLAALAHEHGAAVYLHSDGAIRKAIPDLIAAGVDILNPVQWRCTGMDRADLKRDFGGQLVFHGAVDNQHTLFMGKVADVIEEVKTNIDIFGAGGGFILAPCHALQPVNPLENVVAMYETGYSYGVY